MPTLKILELTRESLAREVIQNTLAINEKLAKTVIQCESNAAYGKGCGNKFFIKNITFLQTHWYETPSGCTGGDTWHGGEGQWECPCCGHRNRLYKKHEIEELKNLFKHIIKVYSE